MNARDRIALLQKLDNLQGALVAVATNSGGDPALYEPLRREMLSSHLLGKRLPDFVQRYPTIAQFWQFIKRKFPTYHERREFIWESFRPAIQHVEDLPEHPSDDSIRQGLEKLDVAHVKEIWEKALDRRTTDPEGAITSARALLETVCKLILDDIGESYTDGIKLPALYSKVATALKVSPSQHAEPVIKQILGGCQSVVEGLGSLRNKLSDAHGQGRKIVKPAPRHAELAVNLAGSMAVFLVATREGSKKP